MIVRRHSLPLWNLAPVPHYARQNDFAWRYMVLDE